MISLEAIISLFSYLAIIFIFCSVFLEISEKVNSALSEQKLFFQSEKCAFAIDTLYLNSAFGSLEYELECYVYSSKKVASNDSNHEVWSETISASLIASAGKSSLKIIPRKHYG